MDDVQQAEVREVSAEPNTTTKKHKKTDPVKKKTLKNTPGQRQSKHRQVLQQNVQKTSKMYKRTRTIKNTNKLYKRTLKEVRTETEAIPEPNTITKKRTKTTRNSKKKKHQLSGI